MTRDEIATLATLAHEENDAREEYNGAWHRAASPSQFRRDAAARAIESFLSTDRAAKTCHGCRDRFTDAERFLAPLDAVQMLPGRHATYIGGRFHCPRCWFVCPDCAEPTSCIGSRYTRSGTQVCEGCCDNYLWCANCGSNVRETDDDGNCPDCNDDDGATAAAADNNGVLGGYHSHSFSGRGDAWSKAHNGRLFGVELEVECGGRIGLYESADQTATLHKDIVLETDGSLNHGYEIITQPRGMDTQRAIWRTILAAEPSQVRGLRSHNTTTCGLHVHVSRAGISSFTLAKAVVFVNDPANESLIRAIARRYAGLDSVGGYAKCKTKKLSSAHRADDGDRYQAVNLCNRRTVEFRMFRGSLNYRAVIAAIQFCHTLLSFAETASAGHLTTAAFLAFLAQPEQGADSDELRPYLAARAPHLMPQSVKDAKSLAEKAQRRHHASNHIGRYADCPHCANDTSSAHVPRVTLNESEN